jgi:hypothetical protein
MLNYLLSVHPGFGPLSWLSMLGWLGALAAGAYLYSIWQERNPVRARFFRQFGLGLSILGAVGLLLLALKAFGLPYVAWPIWSYLVMLATLLFLAWAGWFYMQRLPRLLAMSSRQVGRPAHGARTYTTNGSPPAQTRPPAPPRPVATTGRREARRDRKRKGR